MLITVDDWNSKVENKPESNIIGKLGLGVRNETKDWLVDFCEANNLSIANMCFKQLNGLPCK